MKQLGALVLTCSLVVGCGLRRGDEDRENDTAEIALESTDSAEAEGNVMMAVLDGADVSAATADGVAARIAANAAARWSPAGCATVTQSGATLTIAYADCTGPRGLVHVSGTLTAAVTVKLDGTIAVHASSDDLRVNAAQLTVEADATYVSRATEHELVVATRGAGTGPRGRTVEHEGDYTITWDTATQCRRLAGTWATEIGDASRGHVVDVRRCAEACPTGTVTRNRLDGATVTLTFDGTSTASWTASTGRSGTIALRCR